jgi:hypothetical protein
LHREPSAHAARLVAELRHVGFVAAGVALWLASRKRPISATPAGFLLLLACLVLPMAFDPQIRVCRREDAAAQYGRPVGEWLRTHLPSDALVATNAAGALPYFSDLPTLDMLGLTDRHIARSRPDRRQWVGHERGDGAYVLSRQPAIIIFGGPEGSLEPWPFPGDRQLAADPGFARLYEPHRVPLPGFDFTFWCRRDVQMPRRIAPPGL